MSKLQYNIENINGKLSCLPVHLNKSDLIDITVIANPWSVYLDTQTNKVYDSLYYYLKYMQDQIQKDK